MKRIPLFDLSRQHADVRGEIDAAIRAVADSQQFVLGPNVKAFEREAAEYIGVKHAVGVASGTDALLLSLRVLEIGPGDEVILPANSGEPRMPLTLPSKNMPDKDCFFKNAPSSGRIFFGDRMFSTTILMI